MKNNFKQKLIQTIKVGFFLSFLIVQFFWFGVLPNAQAGSNACGFSITFGASPTTVQLGQPIVFNIGLKANPGSVCFYSNVTVVVWANSSINSFVPLFSGVYSFDNTKSNAINVAQGSWSPSAPAWQSGNTVRLFAGAISGDQTNSDGSYSGGGGNWDTQSGEVDVAIGSGASGASTTANSCTKNTDCSSQGLGYICQGSSCVEATAVSSFSCSNNNSTMCPTGLFCLNSQCLEACGNTGNCDYVGETCDAVSTDATYKYCTTSTGSGPSGPPSASNPSTTGPAMASNSATTLFNPLPEQDLTHVFLLITQGLLAILGIFAVVFVIVGGVEMVIAAGNEEALAKAKKTIVWAILGLVIALMSFSIIAIVEDLLQVNIPAQPSPTSIVNVINNKV